MFAAGFCYILFCGQLSHLCSHSSSQHHHLSFSQSLQRYFNSVQLACQIDDTVLNLVLSPEVEGGMINVNSVAPL